MAVNGILRTVNYEDRTDLLPPEVVVSASLLSKLRRAPEAARLMRASASDPSAVSVSSAAYEAIVQRVAEDTAPDQGAPPEARAVEEDAMLCGYRFGRLALGPLPRTRPISPEKIRRRTDSMYLYNLVIEDAQIPFDTILRRNVAQQSGYLYALEEAVTWAWSFGLGVALVEADLDAAGSDGAPESPAPGSGE